MKVQLRDGLRVEDLGDGTVVLDAAGAQVHRVQGDAAAVVALLAASPGAPVEVPEDLRSGLDDLIEAGVVEAPEGWSRRKVMAVAGATWAAATVPTFALADPAAATTNCPNGHVASDAQPFEESGTFTTGAAGESSMYTLWVRAWGGGGEYRAGNIEVTECTPYAVIVGAGGQRGGVTGMAAYQGGNGTTQGTAGGASSFGGTLLIANGGIGGMGAADADTMGGAGAGGAGGSGGMNGSEWFNGGNGGNGSTVSGEDGNSNNNWGNGGGGGGGAGSEGAGGDGGDGVFSGVNGAAGAGGDGPPGGGDGGEGGWDDHWGQDLLGGKIPGGGGGGQEETGGAAAGGDGARGEVWVGL